MIFIKKLLDIINNNKTMPEIINIPMCDTQIDSETNELMRNISDFFTNEEVIELLSPNPSLELQIKLNKFKNI